MPFWQDFSLFSSYLSSTWAYKKIVPMELIEFIENLADRDGNNVDPVQMGKPPFPKDMRTTVTFKEQSNGKTEMTVIEYEWTVGQIFELAEAGLNQCLNKMPAIFVKVQS